ncbi:MAG: hypothetical protein V1495_10075 [Pseudomonadota bacterium]
MRKISILLFSLNLLLAGCPISNSTGGGGGSGGLGGGGSTPPGETGEEAGGLVENPMSSLCVTRGGRMFLTSSGGKTLVSSNGSTFTVLDGTARDLRASWCDQQSTSATDVWFAGSGGKILHYNGSTLSEEISGIDQTLNGLFGTDISNVYAVGEGGTIVHRSGTTWGEETSGVTGSLRGISGIQPAVYAVGSNRTVLRSGGSGSWAPVSLPSSLDGDVPPDTNLNGIWVQPVSGGSIFIVADGGRIFRGTIGGITWTKMDSGTSKNLRAVSGTSASQVFAVGDSGVILSFDGTNWTKQTNPEDDKFSLFGVLPASATSAFAVGADGTSATSNGVILGLTGSSWASFK